MSYYVEELPAFWKMRRHFKMKFELAYRRYDLPEFVYWYCQWVMADEDNPHCNMFWLDHLKNIRFYQIVMNRARSADKSGLDSRPYFSDIIRETCPIAGVVIGSEPDHRKWKYRHHFYQNGWAVHDAMTLFLPLMSLALLNRRQRWLHSRKNI